MSPEAVDLVLPRARTRRGAAAEVQRANIKTRVYLSLDLDAAQRLGIHAVMADRDKGEIVSELVRTHLRDWHVRRGATRASGDGPDEAVA